MARRTTKTFREIAPQIKVQAWDELRRYTTYVAVLATKATVLNTERGS